MKAYRLRSRPWHERQRKGLWATVPWWMKWLLHLFLIYLLVSLSREAWLTGERSSAAIGEAAFQMMFAEEPEPDPWVPSNTNTVTILVTPPDPAGNYVVDGSRLDPEGLAAFLGAHGDAAIVIKADEASLHSDLLGVLQTCTEAGIFNVSVLSSQAEADN